MAFPTFIDAISFHFFFLFLPRSNELMDPHNYARHLPATTTATATATTTATTTTAEAD